MFTEESKPLSEKVRQAEYETYKAILKKEFTTILNTVDKFQEGNVLYMIDTGMTSYNNLLTKYNKLTSTLLFSDIAPLFKEVTTKVISIKANADIRTCLKTINQYRKKAGLNFYGALLRSTSKKSIIINPFHPLTAIALSNSHNRTDKYNILIYFYPNRSKMDQKFNSKTADISVMNENLNDILRTYQSDLSKEQIVEDVTNNEHNNDRFDVKYRIKTDKNNVDGADYYIVAHQLVTKGIISPYYGTSFIKKSNNSTYGKHLAPFRSANIGAGDATKWTSVCTGSQPKNFEGFKSLTHSNLSSPFSTTNIMNGALIYADLCINKAYTIYQKIGLIDNINGLIIEPIKDSTPPSLMSRLSPARIQLFYENRIAFTRALAKDPKWPKDDILKVLAELTEKGKENEQAQREAITRQVDQRINQDLAQTLQWGITSTAANPYGIAGINGTVA